MSLQFVVTKPRGPLGWWILAPVLGLSVGRAVVVGGRHAGSASPDFIDGLPWIADFLGRMLPPNFAFMEKLVKPAIETVQIALWGTLLGIVLALPVCFFAARNLSPYAWVFHGLRQVLNVMRGINEIILALIFVAAVGLGPFAGVLAIALHGAGMLGKFFAEAIEEIDEGPLDALRAAGAGTLQTHRVRRAAAGPAGLDRRRALPLRDQHPRLDRARHGGRGRHRLRADQLA